MSIPLRALLFRRISEPAVITVDFDGEVYLVRVRRHRQARRYTLRIHAASREVVLTIGARHRDQRTLVVLFGSRRFW